MYEYTTWRGSTNSRGRSRHRDESRRVGRVAERSHLGARVNEARDDDEDCHDCRRGGAGDEHPTVHMRARRSGSALSLCESCVLL